MNKILIRSWLPLLLALLLVPAQIVTAACVLDEQVVPRSVSDTAFALDMSVSIDPVDITAMDVVITIKDIQQELDSVEFVLDFDEALVEGVITENGDDMDVFMTVTPMYTMVIANVEVPSSRYEQICSYDEQTGSYYCRFVDSLRYPNAKPGEARKGLIGDGDLVITIPFRLVSLPASGSRIGFSITDALGTTREDLLCVKGKGDTASVELVQSEGPVVPPNDLPATEGTTAPTAPTAGADGTTAPDATGDSGDRTDTVPTDPAEETGIPSTEPATDSDRTDVATTVAVSDSDQILPTDPLEESPDVQEASSGVDTAGDTGDHQTGVLTDGAGEEGQPDQHPGKPGHSIVVAAIVLVVVAAGAIAGMVLLKHRKMR